MIVSKHTQDEQVHEPIELPTAYSQPLKIVDLKRKEKRCFGSQICKPFFLFDHYLPGANNIHSYWPASKLVYKAGLFFFFFTACVCALCAHAFMHSVLS